MSQSNQNQEPQQPHSAIQVDKEWELYCTLLAQMNEAEAATAAAVDGSSSSAASAASAPAAPSAPVLRRIAHSLQVDSKVVLGDCATFARLLRFLHLRVVRNSQTRELRVMTADLLNAFEMRNTGYEWTNK